ncbi:MAG: DUF4418 family protein [Clostridia bacterium]|nr:DUF4418 family protein [Clostridia bacterium]
MKKIHVSGIVLTVLAAVQAIGARTFLHPCVHEDGSLAACAGAGDWLFGLGLAGILLGLGLTLLPVRGIRLALCAAALAWGVCTLLAPGTLSPICMMPSMRCQMVTRPGALVLGVLILLCAAGSLVIAARKGKRA